MSDRRSKYSQQRFSREVQMKLRRISGRGCQSNYGIRALNLYVLETTQRYLESSVQELNTCRPSRISVATLNVAELRLMTLPMARAPGEFAKIEWEGK